MVKAMTSAVLPALLSPLPAHSLTRLVSRLIRKYFIFKVLFAYDSRKVKFGMFIVTKSIVAGFQYILDFKLRRCL